MLNWNNAKQGEFYMEERETLIITNTKQTLVTTSEKSMINQILKLYEELEIKVLYYMIDAKTNEKIPSEICVEIPKGHHIKFRKL